MFKGTSQNRQHAIDRRGSWAAWANGETPITPEGEWQALRKIIAQIEAQLPSCTDAQERAALGRRKCEAQERIAELRKAGLLRPKKGVLLTEYIVEVLKPRFSKGEWAAVIAAAERLKKEADAMAPADQEAA